MSANTLVLNSNNVIGSNNSQFQYNFVNGNFQVKEDAEMCISQLTVPYSWYNITTALGNNALSYTWSNGVTYNITIPDGFYTQADINAYLQQVFITNNHYLVNSSGQNVYYIAFSANVSYYKNQFLFFTVPTALPSGWTAPVGFVYPGVSTAPSITIPATNIQYLIGFSAGVYGGGGASSSDLSNLTPNMTSVNGIIVRCSICENNVASPNDVLDTFYIQGTSFGSNINYLPSFEKWIKIRKGTYSSFIITFQDQNFNTLYARDPNVLISLLIRSKQ